MTLFHRLNPWRPGRRKWALLALILAGSPFYAWLYYKLGEVDHPDYSTEMLALVLQNLPPEGQDPNQPNAWDILEEAMEAVRQANLDLGGTDGDGTPDSDLTLLNLVPSETTVWRRGEEFGLATPEETLDALEGAGFFSQASRLRDAMRVVPPTPAYLHNQGNRPAFGSATNSRARTGAFALLERAVLQVERGNQFGAVESLEAALAMGRVMVNDPDLLTSLTGQSVRMLAFSGAKDIVNATRLSEEALRSLIEAVRKQSQALPVEVTLECNRLIARAMIASTLRQARIYQRSRINPVAPFVLASEREMMRATDEIFEAAKQFAATPHCSRDSSAPDPEAIADALPRRFVLVQIVVSGASTTRLAKLADTLTMHERGLQLLAAVERFQRINNEYPASLDDLAPSILPEVPKDPLAPDGQFRYARVESSAGPGSFILYSVGADCTDDGGNHSGERAPWQGDVGTDVLFSPSPES